MVEVELKIPADVSEETARSYEKGEEFKWRVIYDKLKITKSVAGVILKEDRLKIILSKDEIAKIKKL